MMILVSCGCEQGMMLSTTTHISNAVESETPVYRNKMKIEFESSKNEYNMYQDTNPINSQQPQHVEVFIQKDNLTCSHEDSEHCHEMGATTDFGSITLEGSVSGFYDVRVFYHEDCSNTFDGQCSRHSPVTIQTTLSITDTEGNIPIKRRFCMKFESASWFAKTVYRITRNEHDYMLFLDMKGYEGTEIKNTERCFE